MARPVKKESTQEVIARIAGLVGRQFEYRRAPLAALTLDPDIAMRTCSDDRAQEMKGRILAAGAILMPLVTATIAGDKRILVFDGAGRLAGGLLAGVKDAPIVHLGEFTSPALARRVARQLSSALSFSAAPTQDIIIAAVQEALDDGLTAAEAGACFGKSAAWVDQYARVNRLAPKDYEAIRPHLKSGALPFQVLTQLCSRLPPKNKANSAAANPLTSAQVAKAILAVADDHEAIRAAGGKAPPTFSPAEIGKRLPQAQKKKDVAESAADANAETPAADGKKKKTEAPGATGGKSPAETGRTLPEIVAFFTELQATAPTKRISPAWVLRIIQDRQFSGEGRSDNGNGK